MQKLRVCSIAMKRGTMRVRAEVVNLRAWGDSSVERRATKKMVAIESGWARTSSRGRIVRRFSAGARLATGTVALQ
jgi:hypothetical protein